MLCCRDGLYPISQGEQHNLLLRTVPLEIVWRMDWEKCLEARKSSKRPRVMTVRREGGV